MVGVVRSRPSFRVNRRGTIGLISAVLAVLSVLAWPHTVRAQQGAAAEVLFEEGRKAMEAGDYAAACRKFEESNRLDPAVGTVFNLANCEEQHGRVASAWEHFKDVSARVPQSDRRKAIANERIAALGPRLPYLTIRLRAAVEGTHVLRDGVELGKESLDLALPVDPGEHEIVVRAPERRDETFRAMLVEGERKSLEVEPGARVPYERFPSATEVRKDAGPSRGETVGPRAGRFGAFVRADVDGRGRGAVGAPGVLLDALDQVELGVAALLGTRSGVEPAASIYLLKGRWQPRLTLGAPIFFFDSAYAGVRGSVGFEFGLGRTVGIFADVGAVYFPAVPASYENLVFLPSAGAVDRL